MTSTLQGTYFSSWFFQAKIFNSFLECILKSSNRFQTVRKFQLVTEKDFIGANLGFMISPKRFTIWPFSCDSNFCEALWRSNNFIPDSRFLKIRITISNLIDFDFQNFKKVQNSIMIFITIIKMNKIANLSLFYDHRKIFNNWDLNFSMPWLEN